MRRRWPVTGRGERVALLLLCVLASIDGGRPFFIRSKSWSHKGHRIAYEVTQGLQQQQQQPTNAPDASTAHADLDESSDGTKTVPVDYSKEPIVLLNGFGVGSFHQHRLIEQWFGDHENDRLVYGIDYLGQGNSWPTDCDDGNSLNESGLVYSADTWIEQLIGFIEEVVLADMKQGGNSDCKVHLVGNSVGGHLAAHLAVRRPDLVESICLLNPTPVWGLNLPGWSGALPAPTVPRKVGRYLFDRIRDLNTIEKYLRAAYSNQNAFDTTLMDQIRGCTLGAGGHAAFASILWSPPLRVPGVDKRKPDFRDCLERVECDVLLIFGKDDPWCKPAFGRAMMEALDKRMPGKVHRYVEIENAGHCPNHEAPKAVSNALSAWVNSCRRDAPNLTIVNGRQSYEELWGLTTAEEKRPSDIQVSLIDRLAVQFL